MSLGKLFHFSHTLTLKKLCTQRIPYPDSVGSSDPDPERDSVYGFSQVEKSPPKKGKKEEMSGLKRPVYN
jgi:hypothetical protein